MRYLRTQEETAEGRIRRRPSEGDGDHYLCSHAWEHQLGGPVKIVLPLFFCSSWYGMYPFTEGSRAWPHQILEVAPLWRLARHIRGLNEASSIKWRRRIVGGGIDRSEAKLAKRHRAKAELAGSSH